MSVKERRVRSLSRGRHRLKGLTGILKEVEEGELQGVCRETCKENRVAADDERETIVAGISCRYRCQWSRRLRYLDMDSPTEYIG